MNCPSCGTENPEGARFCQACGHSLQTAQNGSVQPSWADDFPAIYELSKIDLTWQTISGILIFIVALVIGLFSALTWISLTVQIVVLILAYWAIRGQFSRSYWRPSSWRVYLLIRK